MELGLRMSWGRIVPGKEKESLVLFQDAVNYVGKKMADGKVTFFEPFFMGTGDYTELNGFFILKGPVAEIFAILEDDEFKMLNTKAHILVDHYAVDLLTVGEEVEKQLKRFEKAAKV
ncbi:MAG: hypothetical protein ACXVP8_06470 [Actinomycetota bacterium]